MKTYLMRLSDEEMARYKAAAEAAGMTFIMYVVTALEIYTESRKYIIEARDYTPDPKLNMKRPQRIPYHGKCPAVTPAGTRCKLCGKVH